MCGTQTCWILQILYICKLAPCKVLVRIKPETCFGGKNFIYRRISKLFLLYIYFRKTYVYTNSLALYQVWIKVNNSIAHISETNLTTCGGSKICNWGSLQKAAFNDHHRLCHASLRGEGRISAAMTLIIPAIKYHTQLRAIILEPREPGRCQWNYNDRYTRII